jgi:hypothetical protein
MPDNYALIFSTLEGVFGADVGYSDEEARVQLQSDLKHAPFIVGIIAELDAAFRDPTISWRTILADCKVASVDTDAEALELIKELFKDVFTSSQGAA